MKTYHFITIEEKNSKTERTTRTSMAINITPIQYVINAQKEGRQIVLLYAQAITREEFDGIE